MAERPPAKERGYDMIKRLADWLEKASVGSLLIGIFQEQTLAMGLGAAAFTGSMILTFIIKKEK